MEGHFEYALLPWLDQAKPHCAFLFMLSDTTRRIALDHSTTRESVVHADVAILTLFKEELARSLVLLTPMMHMPACYSKAA